MHIDLSALSKALSSFPSEWDGKESILAMKESGYPQWRQMEWIGFFFQFLCENRLPSVGMNIPGHSYGNTTFDGFMCIDWDFKAHPIHNKNGKEANKLIANDLEATVKTVEKYGKTGLIVAVGEASFDNTETMPFRAWLTNLKGGESAYSLQNRIRGAKKRLYKTSFSLKHIDIYVLGQDDIKKQGVFQKGMRNSNGNPRREKLEIDLDTIAPLCQIKF